MMHPFLNIAIRTARKTGNLIIKIYENLDTINENSYIISHVLKKVEKIIIDVIHQSYPQHEIIFDIYHPFNINTSNIQWIINPINGITNFSKKFPHFALAIAIRVKGQTEIAVVYDFMRNELFTAVRGQGTKLNGYRLRSSRTNLIKNITNMLFATDLSAIINHPKSNDYIRIIKNLLRQGVNLRSTGSDILDLAYVAAGRFNGYFNISTSTNNLPLSSLICGKLLIRESGALVTDYGSYKEGVTHNDHLLAGSNSYILKLLIKAFGSEY
ncbi:MAG: inositol monophosphatase family protein [Candidatus Dasytiphilus stammeri]